MINFFVWSTTKNTRYASEFSVRDEARATGTHTYYSCRLLESRWWNEDHHESRGLNQRRAIIIATNSVDEIEWRTKRISYSYCGCTSRGNVLREHDQPLRDIIYIYCIRSLSSLYLYYYMFSFLLSSSLCTLIYPAPLVLLCGPGLYSLSPRSWCGFFNGLLSVS